MECRWVKIGQIVSSWIMNAASVSGDGVPPRRISLRLKRVSFASIQHCYQWLELHRNWLFVLKLFGKDFTICQREAGLWWLREDEECLALPKRPSLLFRSPRRRRAGHFPVLCDTCRSLCEILGSSDLPQKCSIAKPRCADMLKESVRAVMI